MKLVTSKQMRELDRETIAGFGVSGEELMDRAGLGVAKTVEQLAKVSGLGHNCPVLLFAGRGNNGGDTFAAARHLKQHGFNPEVWLTMESKTVSGDSMKHFGKMMAEKVKMQELPGIRDWDDAMTAKCISGGILVDGILGTGTSGPARGPVAGAIQFINKLAGENLVVAIDVPSGLDPDTGLSEGGAVFADVTVTMGLPKTGLIEPAAIEYVGAIDLVDIGIPHELLDKVESDRELVTASDLRGLLKRRARNSHKGTYGHILIIGGAAGYAGAVSLAARAAVRSGVGLVTVLTPKSVAPVVAGCVPEAMVHSASEVQAGSFTFDCLDKWGRDINDFDAVLIGPGMTTQDQVKLLVHRILKTCRKPLVMDADALNVCVGSVDLLQKVAGPVVITPHPGEMARLLNWTVEQVQANRFHTATTARDFTGATVVLKGAGTIIASREKPLNVSLAGNPGMAKGGMGDVLGGVIVGLVGQGLELFDAARTGVYLHNRAADNVALRSSQSGMNAGDVANELANVFREITAR
ncbi:MAG: bifunctional ADP-dependent NAD(P)H-hydrate dehydratase/NAD(P)H-hydrate epimerase [Verrucomicrobia bacterium]|nr:bifunctional ADP-dependent NAD(P)H-hydrate dehydratase/NAD(P)H-hydrate epimerase [Verrucomicrobiota bacterium]